jgi:hypothetical protein
MEISKQRLEGLIATGDSRFEFTQLGRWMHIRDRISGEGYWVWNGTKEIHGFNKASTAACEKGQEPTR